MTQSNILVIEDEDDLRDIITYNLKREGYKTQGAETGEQGLQQAVKNHPDLILLDLMLPGMNGLDICRHIKGSKSTENIPIIMVSAKGEESDIIVGLELGADDYVTKPFSPRILLARIQTILRRPKLTHKNNENIKVLIVGNISIDARKFQLNIDDQPVDLTKTEFTILHFLASHRGWVFTRYQIVDAIRGDQYVVTERSIDVQIAGLRKKMRAESKLIETVRGVGYRFKE